MRCLILCVLMCVILSETPAQDVQYEPITANNIGQLQQIAEITLHDPSEQWFRFHDDYENGLVMVRGSNAEHRLYDLMSGDLLRAFTPSDSDYWYDGFRDLLPPATVQREDMLYALLGPPIASRYHLGPFYSFSPDSTRMVSHSSTLYLADPEERGTLIEVIAPDGTRLNRIEYPYIANRISWTPDGSHFLMYATGEMPGQTPGVFTADGTLIHMLDHSFPMDEAVVGIEHVRWLDNTRLLTIAGYRLTFIRAAYIWDVTTAEPIATILPDEGNNWRMDAATDDSRFVIWNARTVRVMDEAGVVLAEFPNDGFANLTFINNNQALLGWRGKESPFSTLDLDGTVLGESDISTVDLQDDIYSDYHRAFTEDRSLMAASPGDDCRELTPSLYLWSLEDPGIPLAEMPYNGYVSGPVFLADMFYAVITVQPGYLPDCDYELIEEKLIFWNFAGERVLEFPEPEWMIVVDNLLVIGYPRRITVWGVPP